MKKQANVGKYTSPMDGMGIDIYLHSVAIIVKVGQGY